MACNTVLNFYRTVTATNQKCTYGIQNSRANDKNACKANFPGTICILREIIKCLIKIIRLLNNLTVYISEIPDQISSIIYISMNPYWHLFIWLEASFVQILIFSNFWLCNFEAFLSSRLEEKKKKKENITQYRNS